MTSEEDVTLAYVRRRSRTAEHQNNNPDVDDRRRDAILRTLLSETHTHGSLCLALELSVNQAAWLEQYECFRHSRFI